MNIQTEQIVSMPVVNPETGASSRTFRYLGRADRIEGTALIDWKTVADIPRFIQTSKLGFQNELYALAIGESIDRVSYRLITRPTIKLCGKDKTPQDYEERCVEWLTQPNKMEEHELFLNPAKFEQARAWLWQCSKRILESRNKLRWLPNNMACYTWTRECEYMPLCMAIANGGDPETIIEAAYQSREAVHAELNKDANKDVLTYSSCSCLCLCEQKYHWRFERLVEPVVEDDSEAREVGSVSHVALDAFTNGGIEAAREAVDSWVLHHPAIGQEATKQDQRVAQALAIARAAFIRWPVSAGREVAAAVGCCP